LIFYIIFCFNYLTDEVGKVTDNDFYILCTSKEESFALIAFYMDYKLSESNGFMMQVTEFFGAI